MIATLFDFDGVLVDSEPVHLEAFRDVVRPLGISITDEEYARRMGWGHSSVTHAAAFARAAGVRQLALFHHDPMRSDRELEELYDQVIYIPLGQYRFPSVWRRSLSGILEGPAPPVFWNVDKSE